jgi:A/G-specific adenine glycosylase
MPATLQSLLLRWYAKNQRDLPWRRRHPNAYHVLLSEFMLQQTQVATVVPFFLRFLRRFPHISDLAAAGEQDVLRLWQGLGYYSRARNLHAAARQIVAEHDGQIPSDAAALQNLPGVGRYTAGAVASIAFNRRAPILDGNVARVLCRLDAIRSDPRNPSTRNRLWRRAEQILPLRRSGQFNSALMDLGATICTPRQPKCPACPIRRFCRAYSANLQHRIPPPRKSGATPLVQRCTFAVARGGRWLIEQRPPIGRWPGMWQFVTFEANASRANPANLLGFPVTDLRPLGSIHHALSHRRYHFSVYACRALGRPPGRWVTLKELSNYPLPKPHVLIAGLLESAQ